VFTEIYWVFTILGTLVGAVVIGYMLYSAYKYRDEGDEADTDDRPRVGELPSGGGKGRKLFLSFALSAIIVLTLIVGTYGSLLFVEGAVGAVDETPDICPEPSHSGDGSQAAGNATGPLNVTVVGFRFGWTFAYPGGNDTVRGEGRTCENVTTSDVLRVPTDRKVRLIVTSRDVHHNIGITELRAKTDAIPGQITTAWFEATEPGNTYRAKCYELCGAQHSYMAANTTTMTPGEFRSWYNDTSSTNASAAGI